MAAATGLDRADIEADPARVALEADALRAKRRRALARLLPVDVHAVLGEDLATRLDEARLSAVETRLESDLRLGRHASVVGELRELVTEHPLR